MKNPALFKAGWLVLTPIWMGYRDHLNDNITKLDNQKKTRPLGTGASDVGDMGMPYLPPSIIIDIVLKAGGQVLKDPGPAVPCLNLSKLFLRHN